MSVDSGQQTALAKPPQSVSAVIALYKALGGGWLDMPVQRLIPEALRDTMEQRSDWGDLLESPLPADSLVPPPASETLPDE